MIKRIFTLSLIYIFPVLLFGQEIKNEFVVHFSGKDFPKFVENIGQNIFSRNAETLIITPFTTKENNEYFHMKVSENSADTWYSLLSSSKEISGLEYNTKLEWRDKRPNDPRVNEQWYLENIKAFEAWNITTGGPTENGKEFVIAVIDDGFLTNHEDFADIFFINNNEIPNDGKDNDGNGYIDDYSGYNVKLQNGSITSETHGTNVIGVLGARANNNIGISGINWNVKILPLVINATSLDVEKALEYVLRMKKLYLENNGTKGSNIVAVTYSGGISKRFASSFPNWCNLYNLLGQQGVLSIGATTNNNDDVDFVGDMPSTCESNYLIMVTNTDQNDVKARQAGYGKKHIDIGVPGEDILTTTDQAKKYTTESGTSLSAPILAGAVSLLFSSNCTAFQNFYDNSPSLGTLKIKEILLQSGDPAYYYKSGQNADLLEVTTTGKRLNILNALDSLRVRYNDCIPGLSETGELKITDILILNNLAQVNYVSENNAEIELIVFDALGRILKKGTVSPQILGKKVYVLDLDDLSLNNELSPSQVLFIGMSQGKSKAGKGFYYNLK
ncbi:MAG: S8 family serine peptidase [Saprospiraceae bacterium]|nr:S8 family serine peptidase [Saprospiraceae bacterium]MBK6566038.1 S8 family serine peptidase [Saprospiraceae bacterium]MBK7525786.1 S8 family serine peptidase [Saprospiraceae bacterium]MBK8369944.1 S8 family serine peptidase [Saprospiraceae bacterium]MBK8548317.1 S8 family serine peptidase [Saprospiraceae bacterium]